MKKTKKRIMSALLLVIANLLKNDLCRARNRAASSMFRAKAEGDF